MDIIMLIILVVRDSLNFVIQYNAHISVDHH